MARKQSRQDRLTRLSDGRCPIHGIPMYQIDLEYVQLPCGHYEARRSIVECSRRDCEILAYEEEPFQDAVLLPQFQYLLNQQ